MIIRRRLVLTLGAGMLAIPLSSSAQPLGKVWRVGFLGPESAAEYLTRVEALRAGLRDVGYVEGKNLIIEIRWAEEGALISYSADALAIYRRAAHYVDRILKGTKPADLPIERPMAFELVVNLKTAKLLGLTMPPEIMVQATRVIQ